MICFNHGCCFYSSHHVFKHGIKGMPHLFIRSVSYTIGFGCLAGIMFIEVHVLKICFNYHFERMVHRCCCVFAEPQLINACPAATLRKQHQQMMNAYIHRHFCKNTSWLYLTGQNRIQKYNRYRWHLSLPLFIPIVLIYIVFSAVNTRWDVSSIFFFFRCLNRNFNCNSLGFWFPVCSRPLIRAHWPPVNLIFFFTLSCLLSPILFRNSFALALILKFKIILHTEWIYLFLVECFFFLGAFQTTAIFANIIVKSCRLKCTK